MVKGSAYVNYKPHFFLTNMVTGFKGDNSLIPFGFVASLQTLVLIKQIFIVSDDAPTSTMLFVF